MNMTAPPPPDLLDPVESAPQDAVIREARLRARRRRIRYGAVAALVAAGLASFVALDHDPPEQQDAPAVASPDPAAPAGSHQDAHLVAYRGGLHWGWVLVYDDGLVVLPTANFYVPHAPADSDGHVQFRLSTRGLSLVRSGQLPLTTFLDRGTWRDLPSDLWADPDEGGYQGPEITPYVPVGYSACDARTMTFMYRHHVPPPAGDHRHTASGILTRLPPAARAILRGTRRTYLSLPYQFGLGGEPMPAAQTRPIDVQCFALTAGLIRELARLSDDPTSTPPRLVNGHRQGGGLTFTSDDGTKVRFWLALALPDGVIVAEGG
jgi:hypothetical protein